MRPILNEEIGLTRISCTRLYPTAACAAFFAESRMEFVNATDLDRKSGGMHQDGCHVQSRVLRNAHQACI